MNSLIRIGTVSLYLFASTPSLAAGPTKEKKSSAQPNSNRPALGIAVPSQPRPDPGAAAQILENAPAAHVVASTSSSSSSGLAVTLKSFVIGTFALSTAMLRRIGSEFFGRSTRSANETDENGAFSSGLAEALVAEAVADIIHAVAVEPATSQPNMQQKLSRRRAQSLKVPSPSKKVELALLHRSDDAIETVSTGSSEPYSPVEDLSPAIPMPPSPSAQASAPPFLISKQPAQGSSRLTRKLKKAVDRAESVGRVNIDSNRSEVEHAEELVTSIVNEIEGLKSKHGLTGAIERALEQVKQILRGIAHVRDGLKQTISKAIPKSNKNTRRSPAVSNASRYRHHGTTMRSPVHSNTKSLPDSILLGKNEFEIIDGTLVIRWALTDAQLKQLTRKFNHGDFAHLTGFVAQELLGNGEDHNRSFNTFLRSLSRAPSLTEVQINNNEFNSDNIESLMRSLPALTRLDLRNNRINQSAAAKLIESLALHPNLDKKRLLLSSYSEYGYGAEVFHDDDDDKSIFGTSSSPASTIQTTLDSSMEDLSLLEPEQLPQHASDPRLQPIQPRIRRIREALNHAKKRGRMNVLELARHSDIRGRLYDIENNAGHSNPSAALAVLETQIGDFVAKELSEKQGLNTIQSVIDGFGIQKAAVIKQLGDEIWLTIRAKALKAIDDRDFTHFDPLVRDTSCELRALFGIYVYHRLRATGELTEEDLDLSTLIYILSHALETAYGPDGFGADDENEPKILKQFLGFKKLRLSNKQVDSLILGLERAVAYGSVAFARRLSQELAKKFANEPERKRNCRSLLSIFTKKCIFDDWSHKRPVVSCHAICKLALEFARSHKVPLVIRTRLSAKATDANSSGTIIAVYKYIDNKFTRVDPKTIPENTPVLVADALTTRFEGNAQSPSVKEIKDYLDTLDAEQIWMAGAVAHHQFAGEYKYTRLTESPISGFVLSQTAQLLKTAELSGTHILNPYTQLVVHSYVTTLEVALQYAGRVGGSPEDGVELKHGLYFKIQRTAEEVKRLRPGEKY